MKKKAKKDAAHVCEKSGCKEKLKSGHQKWCSTHKAEVRKIQNRKAAVRYSKKWGNQRLTTKQTAIVKLEKKPRVVKPRETQENESIIVGGIPVEVVL